MREIEEIEKMANDFNYDIMPRVRQNLFKLILRVRELEGVCDLYEKIDIERIEIKKIEEKERTNLLKNIQQLQDELEASKEREEPMVEFARCIISDECWGYGTMDGMEIQDFAERLGFIKAHIATESDVDEVVDFEIGDKIYKFTEILGGDNE